MGGIENFACDQVSQSASKAAEAGTLVYQCRDYPAGRCGMGCDLCKHRDEHSANKLLCKSCGEMIQRLLIVRERMAFHEPQMTATAVAQSAAESFIASQWQ
jgi:hypothetical protein